tara:strand:+ start:376 stop:1179 length:804 start_codon:yes stop_codon:yes gene_type:complete
MNNIIKMNEVQEKHIKTIGEVLVYDYSKVSNSEGQRIFNQNVLNGLSVSYDDYGILTKPILCFIDKKKKTFKILDGHHRFEVAKEKKLPILCDIVNTEGYDDNEIMIKLNISDTRQNWKPINYLHNGILYHKNEDYVMLSEVHDETGISLVALREIYAHDLSCSNAQKFFELGIWTASTKSLGDKVVRYVEDFKKNRKMTFYKKANFVRGFVSCVAKEKYDHSHMMRQLKKFPQYIHDGDVPNQFKDMLNKIYNNRAPESQQVYIGS